MALDPTQQQLFSDGEALAKQSLDAIKSAIDSIFGNTEADVPKLSGDAIAATFDTLENLVPASVRPIVAGLLGVAQSTAGTAAAPLEATAVSALKIAQANVDAALNHIGA